MLNINFKNFDSPIEDLDEKGVVTVYGNAFNNKDADGDISAYGSFDKTIKENAHRIKHFLNHDSRLLIGVPLEFIPDEKGLLMRSKLNLKKDLGRDVYEDYKLYKENGKSLEHSIGYGVEKRDHKNKSIITEYKLWEVSTLTSFGANPLTPLVDIKSQGSIIEWAVKMYNLPYSDTRLQQLEKLLKSLEAEPTDEATPAAEPSFFSAFADNSQKSVYTFNF